MSTGAGALAVDGEVGSRIAEESKVLPKILSAGSEMIIELEHQVYLSDITFWAYCNQDYLRSDEWAQSPIRLPEKLFSWKGLMCYLGITLLLHGDEEETRIEIMRVLQETGYKDKEVSLDDFAGITAREIISKLETKNFLDSSESDKIINLILSWVNKF